MCLQVGFLASFVFYGIDILARWGSLWRCFLWRKSMGGEGSFVPEQFAAHQVFAPLPLFATSCCSPKLMCWWSAGVVRRLTQSRLEVRFSTSVKEQGISQVKDFLGMAGLEGRVVVYACKLLLEGHLKCVSRIPQRPGLLLSPVAFWRWESEYWYCHCSWGYVGHDGCQWIFWVIALFGKQNMDIQHALCSQCCIIFSTLPPVWLFFGCFFGGGVNPVITSLASSFLPLGSVS